MFTQSERTLARALLSVAFLSSCGGGAGVLVLQISAGPGVGDVRQIRLRLGEVERRLPEQPASAGILPTEMAVDLTGRAEGTFRIEVDGLGPGGEVRGGSVVEVRLRGGRETVATTLQAGPPGDAGPGDAGPQDAGPGDAGPRDAGPSDAGPRDAGPGDAGPGDAGPDGGGGCVPGLCGAGKVCLAGTCQTVLVDITAPTAPVLRSDVTVSAAVYGPAPVQVVFTAAPRPSGTPVTLGNSLSSPYTASWHTKAGDDGRWVLTARAEYVSSQSASDSATYTVDNTGPAFAPVVLYPPGRSFYFRDETSEAVVDLGPSDPSGLGNVSAGFGGSSQVVTPSAGRYRFSFAVKDRPWVDADSDGTDQVLVGISATDSLGNPSTGSQPVNVSRIRWGRRMSGAAIDAAEDLVLMHKRLFARSGSLLGAFTEDGATTAAISITGAITSSAALGFHDHDFVSAVTNTASVQIALMDAQSVSIAGSCTFPGAAPAGLLGALLAGGSGSRTVFVQGSGGGIYAFLITPRGVPPCSSQASTTALAPRGDQGVAVGTGGLIFLGLSFANVNLVRRGWDGSKLSNSPIYSAFVAADADGTFPRSPMAAVQAGGQSHVLVTFNDISLGPRLRMFNADSGTDEGTASIPPIGPDPDPDPCQGPIVGPADTTGAAGALVPVYLGCGRRVFRFLAAPNGISYDNTFALILPGELTGPPLLGAGGAAGVLYAVHDLGVSARDAQTGAALWNIAVADNLAGRMALSCGGRLYVGGTQGRVWSLVTDSPGLVNSAWPTARHDNAATGNSMEPLTASNGACR